MTYEITFDDILFEDATHYLEGELYIEVQPEYEESSFDPYGAFPNGAGLDVVGFKVVGATLHYMDRFDNDKQIQLTHKDVLSSIGYDSIMDKLQSLHQEAEDDCPFS